MKPQTYMNNSGIAVGEALRFYKLPPEKLIVLCDDISFDPGVFRIRRKGSAGGHNGLKSIIAVTGSQEFPRIKLGVGAKPSPDYDLADWVLSRFPAADRPKCDEAAKNAVTAVSLITEGKIDLAMAKFSK
jgi:PTH1 family peptidyl-tRNA hydrolase